jgi:hypothetical protein
MLTRLTVQTAYSVTVRTANLKNLIPFKLIQFFYSSKYQKAIVRKANNWLFGVE